MNKFCGMYTYCPDCDTLKPVNIHDGAELWYQCRDCYCCWVVEDTEDGPKFFVTYRQADDNRIIEDEE